MKCGNFKVKARITKAKRLRTNWTFDMFSNWIERIVADPFSKLEGYIVNGNLWDKTDKNWLKCFHATRATKAGLKSLVEEVSFGVQQMIYSSIIHARNLAPGSLCNLCLTENLLLCPTKGLCSHRRNCKYHDSSQKKFRPCPSQICNAFWKKIGSFHRYSKPSWKNTKADQWCTNHWQVAKCFMPLEGYQDVSSFDDTDFNGIINFMINCTESQRCLSFNVASKPNVLYESRKIGRNLRHSPDLKVTDTDLASYFSTLNSLLTDSKYLASDSSAQEAVIKLNQLEKDANRTDAEYVHEYLQEVKATKKVVTLEILQFVKATVKFQSSH
ncbi:uncharacterized protein LOC128237537 [Mya arenaria]|uniref:uncharacterized protein LOC128237537 n=1 Tax=Mya arenaria TaxID=6604 RepID=UPI0022E931FB|nr:uncharacterized protein LOC128237537 [Mya arenaria]